jgi:hypothetical protein
MHFGTLRIESEENHYSSIAAVPRLGPHSFHEAEVIAFWRLLSALRG